jgi:ATP-dependent RNA/DNA helicase IGHMBP2
MNYFEQLTTLLQLEQKEDRQQYEKQMANTTVHQRRTNGIAWYPIAIKNTEPIAGDYISVTVERTTNLEDPHQLRFGMPAVLFSNKFDAATEKIQGVIAFCKGNTLRINLYIDELPDWARQGKLGIDLLFDENSYKEMFSAIKESAKQTEDNNRLLQILTQKKEATFNTEEIYKIPTSLNSFQKAAIEKIVNANQLAIVHGPPGTGKTTTLVHAIEALLRQGAKKILVATPSNVAVDVISERLASRGIQVTRMGNPVRIGEHLQALTMDSKMQLHATNKDIKKLKKQAAEFKDMAHKYKRKFGKDERDQRKLLFTEAHNILKDVERLEKYIIKDIVDNTQVVTATLVGCNQYSIAHLTYDVVVIDEAGQAIEPACFIPILKTQKLILAGDHCQLPPTIKSYEAAKQGLEKTLLEKCINRHPSAVVLLQEQYRMHTSIMQFSSTQFYNNQLQAHTSVAQHLLFDHDLPFLFIDTAGCGFEEKVEGTQISNPEEGNLLLKHFIQFTETLVGEENFSAAIISPYKQQVYYLQECIPSNFVTNSKLTTLSVNTIDSFQGQEKDIVYISLVRSNEEASIGFLSDVRRMNVAMTRARKKLVIVGDSATLSSHPFYDKLISYSQSIYSYESAWSFINL